MIEETDDYWIYQDDYLIFKPSFNSKPNDKLVSKYSKIIFSNYSKPLICLNENNKYNYKYHDLYLVSRFNHLANFLSNTLTHLFFGYDFDRLVNLSNSIINLSFGYSFNRELNLPNSIIQLTFGFAFNRELNLPSGLIHLTFGNNFDQPINLPSGLIHLTFGNNFNQPLNLPNKLRHLTFGKYFVQEVNLPFELKYLKLNSNCQYMIDNLVNSIEELELGELFNLELNNLVNSIRKITFEKYSYYNKDLNLLPDSIEFICLPFRYQQKIYNFPKSLKLIKCHNSYLYKNDFYNKNISIHTYN
jgi:hypothetical protein